MSECSEDEDYKYTRFMINDEWCVGCSSDGRQWILQQKTRQDRWESLKFFSRKENLDRRLKEMFPKLDLSEQVNALPI